MERDLGFWFYLRRMPSPSPKLNLFGSPLSIERLNSNPVSKNFHFTGDPVLLIDGPLLQLPRMKYTNTSKSNYTEPHFQPAFALVNSSSIEKFPCGTAYYNKMENSVLPTTWARRRFLVFDQCDGKTTLNYFSGAETPVPCGTFRMERPTACNLIKGDNFQSISHRYDSEDEIREDTEELNALLYSDTDFPDEDEETSTGHSPSTMTNNGVRDFVEEIGEEMDSSTSPAKRQKLLDGCREETSKLRSVRALETVAPSALEDVAESVPGSGNNNTTHGLCSGTKRKERILETVKLLRSVFPAVNGEEAVDVIDEAILYLKSLKDKAKVLGLESF